MPDRVLETGRCGEQIYGLPFSVSLHLPDSNISNEESLDPAGAGILDIVPYLWSNGGELMNADHTRATGYLDSKSNIEIIEALTEILKEGSDLEHEVLHTLVGQAKNNAVLSSTLLAIPNKTNMNISWELIRALTSDEMQNEFAGLGMIPANFNALESEAAANTDFALVIETLQTARALPNVTQWKEMNNEFSLAIKRIIEGYKTTEQSIKDLAIIWDALLP